MFVDENFSHYFFLCQWVGIKVYFLHAIKIIGIINIPFQRFPFSLITGLSNCFYLIQIKVINLLHKGKCCFFAITFLAELSRNARFYCIIAHFFDTSNLFIYINLEKSWIISHLISFSQYQIHIYQKLSFLPIFWSKIRFTGSSELFPEKHPKCKNHGSRS